MKLSLVFLFLLTVGHVLSANILVLIIFPGKSHWMMFQPIINELLQRGHHVTAITNYEFKTKSNNYRELIIDPPWDWDSKINMTNFFGTVASVKEGTFYKILSIWGFGLATTAFALDSPVVKNFIENDHSEFDLVISEQFYQEAFNMFAHKYNCPIIAVGTLDYSDNIDRARGAMTPISHVPHFLSYNNEKMNFFQRLENFAYSLFDALGRKFYYLPKQTDLARNAFKSLENQLGGRLPSTEDLEKRISLHMMNSHLALSNIRPKMPGMVDIAGVHIKKVQKLPEDIQKFLDEADQGVIYMSFGAFLQSSMMPPEKYEAIIEVFKKLKYRVIWKWERDSKVEFPSNVMVKKWLPQSDILAHKNVKLFISHGGIFGTQEAIYHGVPLVVFPFYGDQHLNGYKMIEKGIAVMRSMNTLTSESLENAINEVMSNQSYYENIKKVSEIFRTNVNEPLDTAVWWIEYIIKFDGAPHLQSHAKTLSFFRYLSLDLVFVIFGAFYVIYDLIKKFYDKLMTKNIENEDECKQQKKKKVN